MTILLANPLPKAVTADEAERAPPPKRCIGLSAQLRLSARHVPPLRSLRIQTTRTGDCFCMPKTTSLSSERLAFQAGRDLHRSTPKRVRAAFSGWLQAAAPADAPAYIVTPAMGTFGRGTFT